MVYVNLANAPDQPLPAGVAQRGLTLYLSSVRACSSSIAWPCLQISTTFAARNELLTPTALVLRSSHIGQMK